MFNSLYLTLLAGPVVPVPVPRIVVDALTSVQVTSSAGEANGFQLTFSLSKKSPLHTIFLVTAGQTPLLRVALVVTLGGLPQVLMDGVITRTEVSAGPGPGQTTLTITGEDLTKLMNLTDLTGIPYPAMPPEVRVTAILSKYAAFGIVPFPVPSLFTDVPVPIDRIPTHQGTDLAYIQQLAKEAGYVFYIEPGPAPGMNVAYWGPEIKVGVPQSAINLDMDGFTTGEAMNFSFNTAETSLPIVFIQNSLTKFPIPIPIPKINPLQPPLGLIPAPVSKVTVLRDTAKLSPMRALSRGVAEAARSADAVSATGTINVVRYGRFLRARQLVGVRGAGLAYDGLYFVKTVSTTIKRGDIKQTVTLTRNGLVSLTPVVPP
jgi:hypothetical protein